MNLGTPVMSAFTESDAFAVAARMEVVDEPAEVPIPTVAEPSEVTAVVELIVPPTRIALFGIMSDVAGVIVLWTPPSTAKLYKACAVLIVVTEGKIGI